MAVKRSRRSMPKASFVKYFTSAKEMENEENCSPSELDLCNSSKRKTRKLSQCDIDLCCTRLRSSSQNSKNKHKSIKNSEKISSNKCGPKQTTSLPSSTTPISNRSRRSSKVSRNSPDSISEISVLTRSRKKSLDMNIKTLRLSGNDFSQICSKDPLTESKISTRKSLSHVRDKNSLKNISEKTSPNHSTSSGTIKDKKLLLSKEVKHGSQKIADQRKYRLRSRSEKISSSLKPAVGSRKRLSLPVDDLVYIVNPKSVLKNNSKKVNDPKPSLFNTPMKVNKAKSNSKVLKISEKKGKTTEKSKYLPKKTPSRKRAIDSTPKMNMREESIINNHSGNEDSKSISAATRSSISAKKSMDSISLSSVKNDKKSKRHTFPMCGKKGKKGTNSSNLKSMPIDDLTILPNSFRVCTDKSSTVCATPLLTKNVSKVRPIPNNKVSSKPKKAAKFETKKTSLSKKKSSLGLQNSIPTKGTLKRKRWVFNTLKERNDGYEDDIFESQKFDIVKRALKMADDDSDTDNGIATPTRDYILTPAIPKRTPLYKECISSTELLEARKVAEEYLYRRNKKWKSGTKDNLEKQNAVNTTAEADLPEKKKLDYSEVYQNLINAQKRIEKLTQEESEEEDNYFSEASD